MNNKDVAVNISIGKEQIPSSTEARNIGAIFDHNLNLKSHISQICRGAWFHLRNIGLIRNYLDQNTTERLIHSFVTSKLDRMNSLLYGLPKIHLEKLSRIHHAAARLIFLLKKLDHISPILQQLHWLPIIFRIEYKIILVTYKALNGLAPTYISELLHPVSQSRSL